MKIIAMLHNVQQCHILKKEKIGVIPVLVAGSLRPVACKIYFNVMSYKSFFFCLLSAILLILSFPKPNLGFLAWFALVFWFFALQREKPGRAFLLSYLVGLVFFSGITYWVNYVSSLGFSVLVLYLALYFAAFGLLFSLSIRPPASSFTGRAGHTPYAIHQLFLLPSIWVLFEYIRSHLFTGFSWALLGYSQFRVLPLIQISDIIGAYGVSFLLVLVNVGIWQAIEISSKLKAQSSKGKHSLVTFSTVLCALILVLGYGYFRLNQRSHGENIKVAVVQGNIPQTVKWDPAAQDYILERYVQLTKQAKLNNPQLVIWPETAVPGFLADEPRLLEEISALSKQIAPAFLLAGTPHEREDGKIYNSAALLFQGKMVQRYDKLHLVPFGEFIPWPKFFSRFAFAGLIGDFTPGSDYTVFSLSPEKPQIKFSALICFEDVFAHLARKFVQKGAGILVNMTNDAWFGDSAEPYQHLQASVFRAVENRVNVVRSANTGVSCFIDPWGRISGRVSDESGRDILVAGVEVKVLSVVPLVSFYTACGDLFVGLCLIVSLCSLIKRRNLRPR